MLPYNKHIYKHVWSSGVVFFGCFFCFLVISSNHKYYMPEKLLKLVLLVLGLDSTKVLLEFINQILTLIMQ